MPPGYHISDDDGLIAVQVRSEVSLGDLYEVARSLLDDPRYARTLPLLLDLRGMRLAVDKTALAPFNRFIIDSYGGEREASIAVVIDTDLDREQCAAIYWLACAVGAAEVFENYDQALKWLIRREFAEDASSVQRG